MKRKLAVLFLASALALCTTAWCQQQPERTNEFLEAKLRDSISNLALFMVFNVVYAEQHGGTAEQLGEFVATQFAPAWEARQDKSPRALVQGMTRSYEADKDFKLEILTESESSIMFRMNWYGGAYLQAFSSPDQLSDNKERLARYSGAAWKTIAEHMGLDYTQDIGSDWITVTITQK